jgi:hypothetical protein
VLGTRREIERLVGEAHQRDQNHVGQQQLERQLGRDQRAHEEELVRGVDRYVEPAARDAAEHGQTRERRQLGGARAQEVAEAAEPRIEAAVHRTPAAAESALARRRSTRPSPSGTRYP